MSSPFMLQYPVGISGALKKRESILGLFLICLVLNFWGIGESTYLYHFNLFPGDQILYVFLGWYGSLSLPGYHSP
jgi:hypothetical protein